MSSNFLNVLEKCAICGQMAHGHHFGVLTCRSCIEFYRRSVLKERKYKCARMGNCCIFKNGLRKCKACRFDQCQKMGIQIYGFSLKRESVSKTLLWQLKNLFDSFLTLQISNPNVFENAENLRNIQQNTKTMIVEMFENCVEIFARMDLEDKFKLVDKCLAQINFLAACQQTLKHFPSGDDGRFFVANGMMVDMVKFNEGNQIDGNRHFSNAKLVQRRFHFVQELKNMPYPVQKVDISVLVAMLLTSKSEGNEDWEAYKNAILEEWHRHHTSMFGSSDIASIQIGRLLSLLPQLDMMIIQESAVFSAILPAEYSSNPFNQQSKAGEHFILHFSQLLKCHKRIWTNFYAFNDEYLHKFERFENLLADNGENILAIFNSNSFTSNLPQQNSNIYVCAVSLETVPHNFWHLLFKDAYVMTLITLGLLKAMPAFRKVDIRDKLLIARHLSGPMEIFIKSFYAAQLGSQTWMRPEGLTQLWALKKARKHFGEDKRLMQIADKCFTHPVQRFHNLQPMLIGEEFALLLAILASSTNISNLSDHARDILYADQNIFSRLLLQHLQANFGMEKGAKRFAECLSLMEGAFIACQNGETMQIYIEAFHGPKYEWNQNMDIPKCLQEMMGKKWGEARF